MSIIIDEDQCTGCGNCIESCPYEAMELKNDKAIVLPNCNLCGLCVENCPVEAISLKRDKTSKEKIDLSKYKGVWVIAEHYKELVHKVAYQLLGKGRELSNLLDSKLTFVILGANFDKEIKDFSEYGMDEIIYVKSPLLKDYYSDLYVKVISELNEEH